MAKMVKDPEYKMVHECSQRDKIDNMQNQLDQLSQVITGKGEPEKGVIAQLIVQNQIQKRTIDTLDRLETKLDKSDKKLEEVEKVAIETYQDFKLYKEAGKKFREGQAFAEGNDTKKKSYNWDRVKTWAAVIALFLTALFGVLNYGKNTKIQEDVHHNEKIIEGSGIKIDKLPQ